MSSQPYLHPVQDTARFEAGDETVDNSSATSTPPTGGDGGGTAKAQPAPKKARAEKALPTDRMKFDTQVAVLKYVAQISGNNKRGSTSEAMSAAVGLKEGSGTGGLNSKFFRSAGWFEPTGRGEYTGSPGAISWYQHINIDPDSQYAATVLMREEARRSWFWETLSPILESGHPISVRVALLELAKSAGASNHTPQLNTIIEWLDWVGLVVREGDQIRLRTDESAPAAPEDGGERQVATESVTPSTDVIDAVAHEPQADPKPVSGASAVDTDAIVSFNLSVRLTADDVRVMDQDQRDFILDLAQRLRG